MGTQNAALAGVACGVWEEMRGVSSSAGEASELKGQHLCGDKACHGGRSEEEEGPGKSLPGRRWASALLVALTDMSTVWSAHVVPSGCRYSILLCLGCPLQEGQQRVGEVLIVAKMFGVSWGEWRELLGHLKYP